MTGASAAALPELIGDEISRPVMAEAGAIADAITAAHGDTVAAILFYGSCLRSGDPEGMLDFYVLVESYTAYYSRKIPALFNWLLPPNVSYWEAPGDGQPVRAKVAVITLARFAAAMHPDAADTTLWARFAQPAALVHARDGAIRARVVNALADATATAAHWAAHLGPKAAPPADYWNELFRATYGAELRVEKADRSTQIVAADGPRYAAMFRPALDRAGLAWRDAGDGVVEVPLSVAARARALSRWHRRRRQGKLLNIARLIKAAFTFEGGADYLAWKIERHTGRKITLTPWQRRHPVLAAPGVWLRLWRRGGSR